MKFVEIVEVVEELEEKLSDLSDDKLQLVESMLVEGSDIRFDVLNHLDYLVEFVDSYSNYEANIIAETVDCGEVLANVLNSARRNTVDMNSFINEAKESVADIDIKLVETGETVSVNLLSIVTNVLTEMLGEKTVERMPAEMVFDIVEEAKNLDIDDDAGDMDIVSLIEEISDKLKDALNEGEIDFDTSDYECETLYEFLDDYEDTDDLLTEMQLVNDNILREANDRDGARLMRKAKMATVLVEGKKGRCPAGDLKCMINKAKMAKEYFSKHEMPGGGNIKKLKLSSLEGPLSKHVNSAIKAFAKNHGKTPSKDYVQFVLVPAIIQRMRNKGRRMSGKSKMKKVGMR